MALLLLGGAASMVGQAAALPGATRARITLIVGGTFITFTGIFPEHFTTDASAPVVFFEAACSRLLL